ncbi:hypothetical protein KUTeg_009402 [Tegillarca granosa]|uniref:C1q domain-containing protein n=1 Tax=Tegillarca granosa TaxID=220873 RepID=A0ABQ9F3V3_TEGGR|nr:hypothetical protein KUTeg_009402 [Tegillarca granosa]
MVSITPTIFLTIVIITTCYAHIDGGKAKTVENILKLLVRLSGNKHELKDHVAFSASLSHDVKNNKVEHFKIIFDKIITNIGNGYNSKTGIFTVPCDGLYVFHWTILTFPGTVFNTELVVNGVSKRGNVADAGGGKSWNSGSSMVTLPLHKNDQVWIRKWRTAGKSLHGNYWPGFSGFRLA